MPNLSRVKYNWRPYNDFDRGYYLSYNRRPTLQEAKDWFTNGGCDQLNALTSGDISPPSWDDLVRHRGRFRVDTHRTREYTNARRQRLRCNITANKLAIDDLNPDYNVSPPIFDIGPQNTVDDENSTLGEPIPQISASICSFSLNPFDPEALKVASAANRACVNNSSLHSHFIPPNSVPWQGLPSNEGLDAFKRRKLARSECPATRGPTVTLPTPSIAHVGLEEEYGGANRMTTPLTRSNDCWSIASIPNFSGLRISAREFPESLHRSTITCMTDAVHLPDKDHAITIDCRRRDQFQNPLPVAYRLPSGSKNLHQLPTQRAANYQLSFPTNFQPPNLPLPLVSRRASRLWRVLVAVFRMLGLRIVAAVHHSHHRVAVHGPVLVYSGPDLEDSFPSLLGGSNPHAHSSFLPPTRVVSPPPPGAALPSDHPRLGSSNDRSGSSNDRCGSSPFPQLSQLPQALYGDPKRQSFSNAQVLSEWVDFLGVFCREESETRNDGGGGGGSGGGGGGGEDSSKEELMDRPPVSYDSSVLYESSFLASDVILSGRPTPHLDKEEDPKGSFERSTCNDQNGCKKSGSDTCSSSNSYFVNNISERNGKSAVKDTRNCLSPSRSSSSLSLCPSQSRDMLDKIDSPYAPSVTPPVDFLGAEGGFAKPNQNCSKHSIPRNGSISMNVGFQTASLKSCSSLNKLISAENSFSSDRADMLNVTFSYDGDFPDYDHQSFSYHFDDAFYSGLMSSNSVNSTDALLDDFYAVNKVDFPLLLDLDNEVSSSANPNISNGDGTSHNDANHNMIQVNGSVLDLDRNHDTSTNNGIDAMEQRVQKISSLQSSLVIKSQAMSRFKLRRFCYALMALNRMRRGLHMRGAVSSLPPQRASLPSAMVETIEDAIVQ